MLAGGLNALQNTVIVTSVPFLVIIAGLAVSFWKELVADRRRGRAGAGRAAGRWSQRLEHASPAPPPPDRDRVAASMTNRPPSSPDHTRQRRNDMTNDDRKKRVIETWDAAWDRGEVDALDHAAQPGLPAAQQLDRRGSHPRASSRPRSWPPAPRSRTWSPLSTISSTRATGWRSAGTASVDTTAPSSVYRATAPDGARSDGATFARFEDDRHRRGVRHLGPARPAHRARHHQRRGGPMTSTPMTPVTAKEAPVNDAPSQAGPGPDEAGEPAVRHRRDRGDRHGRRPPPRAGRQRVLEHLPRPAHRHGVRAADLVDVRVPVPASHLAINILSTDQLDVVNRFASKAADKFGGLDWSPASSAAR